MANENSDKAETVVFCHGGCGRWITLKKSSILSGDYYGCEKNKFGFECPAKFLPLTPGKVRITTEFTKTGFYRIRDIWPNKAMIKEYWGSYEAWAYHVTVIAIQKALLTSRGLKLIETVRYSLVWYEEVPEWLSGDTIPGNR